MHKDSFGDRIKHNYEDRYRIKLVRRTPVIIRLDGKAFHTLTRSCIKPYDDKLIITMVEVALDLLKNIQGAKIAYTQSDEISILLTDFDRIETDAWFDYNLQKIVSVSAAMASAYFSTKWKQIGVFDSRAFNIPKEEVTNYFVWRQQDWVRNSIQMLGQANFSAKQLLGKKLQDVQDMLINIGINWADQDSVHKNGTTLYRNFDNSIYIDTDVIFLKNREIVERFLYEDKLI